jgi:hypothetical protein
LASKIQFRSGSSRCLSCFSIGGAIAARRVKHARVGAKIVIRRDWLDAFLGG